MNAYEIIHALETATNVSAIVRLTKEEVIPMLRQQEDHIKELEAWKNHDIELAEAVGFEQAHKLQADRIAELEKDLHMIQRHYDQLDTTPQTKPLTDDEIHELIINKITDYDFARAIEAKIRANK